MLFIERDAFERYSSEDITAFCVPWPCQPWKSESTMPAARVMSCWSSEVSTPASIAAQRPPFCEYFLPEILPVAAGASSARAATCERGVVVVVVVERKVREREEAERKSRCGRGSQDGKSEGKTLRRSVFFPEKGFDSRSLSVLDRDLALVNSSLFSRASSKQCSMASDEKIEN
jgi:hypothetical protein